MTRSRRYLPAVVLGLLLIPAAGASATTKTVVVAEGAQSFEVPTGVTSIQVTAIGGAGEGGTGCNQTYDGKGGNGAKVTATLPVTAGQKLYVSFQAGANGGKSDAGCGNGGKGGGASALGTAASLASRVIAAGGGGGGGVPGTKETTPIVPPINNEPERLLTFRVTGGNGGSAGAIAGNGTAGLERLIFFNAGEAEGEGGFAGEASGGEGGGAAGGGQGGQEPSNESRIMSGGNGSLGSGGEGASPTEQANEAGGGGGTGYYGGGGGAIEGTRAAAAVRAPATSTRSLQTALSPKPRVNRRRWRSPIPPDRRPARPDRPG